MSKLPASTNRLRAPKPVQAAPIVEKKLEFSLPAFSVPVKKKQPINFEKLRKDAIRRQAPQGENLAEIKRIIKDIKGQKLTVVEFINLISPHTGDNGQCLRLILEEELKNFRILARKCYETMTRDVSDVLTNEQLQVRDYYDDRMRLLNDRMMQFIEELFIMIPDFDFEAFLTSPDTYLEKKLKIPTELAQGDEVVEMHRRQMAYHRLQWLRTEEERLNLENAKLLTKLNELKAEQQIKKQQAEEIALVAENERQDLIAEEVAAREELEKLNNSLENSIIQTETALNNQENAEGIKSLLKTGKPVEKQSKGAIRKRKMDWVSTAASQLEQDAEKETRTVLKSTAKRPRGRSPHFSPIKTPPPKEKPKVTSPFHYSPPRELEIQSSPVRVSPSMRQVQEATVTVMGRRNLAPRDTWTGF